MSDGFGLILPPTPGLPWITGNYYDYGVTRAASAPAGSALSANTIYTSLIDVPPPGEDIDRIAIEVTATGTATLARVGIFRIGEDGKPSSLLIDGGAVDVSGTGRKEATVAIFLPPGPIAAAVLCNGTVTLMAYGTPSTSPYGYADTLTTTKQACAVYGSFAYAALPATFVTSSIIASAGPRVGLRAA